MAGHTPWKEIKHKGKTLKGSSVQVMQIVLYDLKQKPLPLELLEEVEESITNILKKYDTVAHTIVEE